MHYSGGGGEVGSVLKSSCLHINIVFVAATCATYICIEFFILF